MNRKQRLTKRLIKEGKVVGYEGVYLCDNSIVVMSVYHAWIAAKNGWIQNVVATGNPVLGEADQDNIYHLPKSELAKMVIRGINGFKVSSLPKDKYPI